MDYQDDRVLKNRNPYRNSIITKSDELISINFIEKGRQSSISPIQLEYQEIWADDACRIIIIELLNQSLDHKELSDAFRMKMTQIQNNRVEEMARQIGSPPKERLLESELLVKFNPDNVERFIYSAIQKLIGVNFITRPAMSVNLKTGYYSLTDLGLKYAKEFIAMKLIPDYYLFKILIDNYKRNTSDYINYNIEQFPLPISYIIMRYIEFVKLPYDQLLIAFLEPKSLAELKQIYIDYLVYIENEDITKIDEKLIQVEIQKKVDDLTNKKLIELDKSKKENNGKYIITKEGFIELDNLRFQFQIKYSDLRDNHLIKLDIPQNPQVPQNPQDNFNLLFYGQIFLTDTGRSIGDKILEIVSNDEESLMINVDKRRDFHEEGTAPIDIEMRRLKDRQKELNKFKIFIPLKIRKGFFYDVMKFLTNSGFIGILLLLGITFLLWSIVLGITQAELFIYLGFILLSISMILRFVKVRWEFKDKKIEYEEQQRSIR